MYKAVILVVSDTEKLIRTVERSRGRVLLRLPDGTFCDLKKENAHMEYLKREADKCRGVELDLSDQADRLVFLKYMMEATLD